MLAFLFGGSQKQSEVGWGWLKIWSQGSFWLSGKVVCFPQTGIKYGDYSEKTRCHKEKGTRRLNRMPRFVMRSIPE